MSVHSIHSNNNTHYNLLEDRDVQALGVTSKAMYEIAKNELLERDKKLEQLLSNYTTTHQYNILNLRDVKLFSMGEIHDRPECLLSQVALIDFLASRGPIILILERWPSLQPFPITDSSLKRPFLQQIRSSISCTNIKNIHSIGWDDLEEVNKLEAQFEQEYKRQNEQLDPDRKNLINTALNVLQITDSDRKNIFSELTNLDLPLDEGFPLVMEKILSIGKQFQPAEKVNYISNLFEKVETSFQKIRFKRNKELFIMVRKTFPIRTKSMTKTVQGLNPLRITLGIPNAKAILIGGMGHFDVKCSLIEDSKYAPLYGMKANPSIYDLTPFYQELANHPTVVLVPKASTQDKI